jgi:hypothetical protein
VPAPSTATRAWAEHNSHGVTPVADTPADRSLVAATVAPHCRCESVGGTQLSE